MNIKTNTLRPATRRLEALEAQVRMLGGFELHVGNAVIAETLNRSNKMWALLSYIVMRRSRNVPQAEFIDLLWSNETEGNPSNALKTLLYRTRMTISPIVGPSVALILSQRGSYSWNRQVKCVVDAEIFEELCHDAETEGLTTEDRIEIYRKIVTIYRGDFMPKLTDLIWVVTLATHYHNLYLHAVKAFARILVENEMYIELNEVCARALQIEHFDEQIHAYMVLSLLRQGNTTAALNHYETATDLLYRNLGVRPSKALRALYAEIMNNDSGRLDVDTDMDSLLSDLHEAASDPGAFICDPGFFRLAYRLEARRAVREGTSVHIALLTVLTQKGETPPLKLLDTTMAYLLEAVKFGLRKGDVASRYSGAQYVLMLPNANYEDGQVVVDRIVRMFTRQHPRNPLKISYKLFEIEAD